MRAIRFVVQIAFGATFRWILIRHDKVPFALLHNVDCFSTIVHVFLIVDGCPFGVRVAYRNAVLGVW